MRSGYTDDWDGDGPPPEFYEQAVIRAFNGRRGRAAMRELLSALDAMPDKRLTDGQIQDSEGCMCTMGVLAASRGMDLARVPYDPRELAAEVGLAQAMVREIISVNDDDFSWREETPEARWKRVRAWVASQVTE